MAAKVDEAWQARHGSAPLQSMLTVGETRFAGRRLILREGDEELTLVDPVSGALLSTGIAVIEAPTSESEAALTDPPADAEVVVVRGGTPVTRSLVAERARLSRGKIAVIEAELSDAEAATLLLSGRADAVVSPELVHAVV